MDKKGHLKECKRINFEQFSYLCKSVEQRSIEVPRIGTDVNVTCGGKEIAITVSPQYIQRNSMWLRDGSFLRHLFNKFSISIRNSLKNQKDKKAHY